jgi:hypothetical protein
MGGTTRGGGAGSDEVFHMKGLVGRLEMLMEVREGKMVAPIYTEPLLSEKGRESGTYPQAFKASSTGRRKGIKIVRLCLCG